MIKGKLKRGNSVKYVDETGFSATVLLNKVFSVEMLKACRNIDDVQRCAQMGDFTISGYDFEVAA